MEGARDAETLDVMNEISEMAPQALKVYEQILEDDSTASLSLKKQTADTVLKDLLGYEAPKKFEGRFMHAHLNEDTIESIKERSRSAAAAAGILATGGTQDGS